MSTRKFVHFYEYPVDHGRDEFSSDLIVVVLAAEGKYFRVDEGLIINIRADTAENFFFFMQLEKI